MIKASPLIKTTPFRRSESLGNLSNSPGGKSTDFLCGKCLFQAPVDRGGTHMGGYASSSVTWELPRSRRHLNGGKKKNNKHKEFWRDTPWCASRLSQGHVPSVPWYVPSVPGTFCPFSIGLHINQAQMSQVSLGRPEFVPGTPPGHPTAKFLYVIFLYRFFSLHTLVKRFQHQRI